MIYAFPKESSEAEFACTLLARDDIDFEKISRDRTVIRVFGALSQSTRDALEALVKEVSLDSNSERDSLLKEELAKKLLIAGPCAVESERQLEQTATLLGELGIRYLRGGAFKPRTKSASFQGLGRSGLKLLKEVAGQYDLKVVTELMDRSQLDDVLDCADIIQVGSRNMFNYTLLTALGAVDTPILLKRGMAATVDEWIEAAGYITSGGNKNVVLCERGIRTFADNSRFTLDIAAIYVARKKSGLPVIADVSHAAGDRELVPSLLHAALAGGADGAMVEIHPEPDTALSDSRQALSFDEFRRLIESLKEMRLLPGRTRFEQPLSAK
jgi:3-deoxy-7-phosphoheptulonate synthase